MAGEQPATEEKSTTPGSAPLQENGASPGSLDESSLVEEEPSKLLEEERFESDEDQALRLLGERWVVQDECKWTIFEDMEDELQYHRRRSRALGCFVRAYSTLHTEYDRLQEGGLCLQDAYEDLQSELKDAVGGVAYWRELAEARAEVQTQPVEKKVSEETLEEAEASVGCEAEAEVDPNSREALRADMLQDAKDQAARWRKVAEKRSEEIAHLNRKIESATPAGPPASVTPWRGSGTPSERHPQVWRDIIPQHKPVDSLQQNKPLGRISTGFSAQLACSPLRCLSPQRTPQRANNGPGDACAVLALANGAPITGITAPAAATAAAAAAAATATAADASSGAPAATNRRLSFFGSPSCAGGKATTSASAGPAQFIPTPARAWGPGSVPKRCPGLGSPGRKRGEQMDAATAAATVLTASQSQVRPSSPAPYAKPATTVPTASQPQGRPSSPAPYAKPNERNAFAPCTRSSLMEKQAPAAASALKPSADEWAARNALLLGKQARSAVTAPTIIEPATRRQSLSLGEPSRKRCTALGQPSRRRESVGQPLGPKEECLGRRTPPPPSWVRSTSPKPPCAGEIIQPEEELCTKHIPDITTVWKDTE